MFYFVKCEFPVHRASPHFMVESEQSVAHAPIIKPSVQPDSFARSYGAWSDTVIATDAKAGVRYSAERYLRAIQEVS